MRVLVIGSGGREHAIVWTLHQEGVTPFCAPGNPGISEIAECLPQSPSDLAALAECAQAREIDLTLVGPEAPLAAGIVDVFAQRGVRAFGPTRSAAILESSKVFMKRLCERYGIPTAPFQVFDAPGPAAAYVAWARRPLVVKADGLAGGKGVTVAATPDEGIAAVEATMVTRSFGDAGARVVIEDVLEGEEVSAFALCDGTATSPLLPVQDHKRLLEGDRGPNTGGMGASAPVPSVSREMLGRIADEILEPTMWAMAQEGRPFRGVLFAGLMLTAEGPKVLEFNVRLGDPETQALLPLLDGGLAEGVEAVLSGCVERWVPRWRPQSAVCVVLGAEGYPGRPRTGRAISGLSEAAACEQVLVFHAGTASRDDLLVSAGGRVLNVVGLGPTLDGARDRAMAVGPSAHPVVGIVIGSDSDYETMEHAGRVLHEFGVTYEITIASAHRSPARVEAYAREAEGRGLRVIIAGAGGAAHLAGVLAGLTVLPVIGVPLAGPALGGLDALLSTVQMPGGVPVATVGIGGARNAALLAVQILGTADPALRERYRAYKERLAREVEEKAARLTPGAEPGMVPPRQAGGRPPS